ncbi:MAG: hypothetical protein ABSA79_11490 [Candidatus Bathyarchaeia archaeon]|jgi:hypothetical protein
MAQEQIKYKQISVKLVGSNVVNFRLEDGTLLKIFVEVTRAGVAVDRKGPDGMPIYNLNINTRPELETKDRIYFAPPPQVPTQSATDKKAEKAYTS